MKTLKEITVKIGDGLHGTPNYSDDGEYYFINGNNLFEDKILIKKNTKKVSKLEFEKYKKDLGDNTLLVSINGTLGNFAFYNNEKVILGKSACYLNLKDDVDKRYIGYVLKNKYFQKYIDNNSTGSTIKNVSLETIRDYKFDLPSIGKQNKIANFLESFDKKIKINKEMNEIFQKIMIFLFKSWFIDFDPIKAKIQNKLIELPKEISDLFPNELEKTSFGKIPKSWKVKTFGDLVIPKRGKVITKSNIKPGEIPVVAGGIKPPYFHSESNAKSPIVTISGSGNAGFVNLYYQDIWASDCSYINKDITKYVFFSHSFLKINQNKIYHMRHGAVQQHINPKDLMKLEIVIPPEKLIRKYELIATHFHKKISTNNAVIDILSNLKNLLLPKVISNELVI